MNRFSQTLVAIAIAASLPANAETRPLSWPSGWTSPLASRTVPVTANYGALSLGCTNAITTPEYAFYLPYPERHEHLGLDIDANTNDAVTAIADGRVMYVGSSLWGAFWKEVIIVEHFGSDGLRFSVIYGHIAVGTSPLTSRKWKAGDVVRASNRLGKVAEIIIDGKPTSHLHIGAMEGATASIPGFSRHDAGDPKTDRCPSTALDTVNPEAMLKARSAAKLEKSIVGWLNSNGSVTSWLVVRSNGKLVRNWIPSTQAYGCLRKAGSIDRGPMPKEFLDQLPDINGQHASPTC